MSISASEDIQRRLDDLQDRVGQLKIDVRLLVMQTMKERAEATAKLKHLHQKIRDLEALSLPKTPSIRFAIGRPLLPPREIGQGVKSSCAKPD
jgi:hypothetical protein